MANTKLKIDLSAGILEAEGDEAFVTRIYNDFKGRVPDLAPSLTRARELKRGEGPRSVRPEAEQPLIHPKRLGKKEVYAVVKDLDVSGREGGKGLQDFYREKRPASAMECNAVFVYYLNRIAGIDRITPDHVYSCYKCVNARVPAALRQSLLDTSSRKGWLDTGRMEDIKLATLGENFVEHDLPKKGG